MASRPNVIEITSKSAATSSAATSRRRITFNADLVAIALALTLAALIRFNVIHHIGW